MIDHIDVKGDFQVSSTEYDGISPMNAFHAHHSNEIMFVTRGRSVIMTETMIRRASGHYIIFYPAGMAHQQINDSDTPYFRYRLNFRTSFLAGILPLDRIPKALFVSQTDEATHNRLISLMELLCSERGSAETYELTLRQKFLTAAILTIINEQQAKQDMPKHDKCHFAVDDCVRDICVYISLNYSEKLSFSTLCDKFFMSRSSLARAFRVKLGMTVGEYILNVRISEAKRMLAAGKTVAETAETCGFPSDSYFIHLFRRETGETPAGYRARIKQ